MNRKGITQRIVNYFRVLFLWAVAAWLLFPEALTRTYTLLTPLALLGMYIGTLDIEYNKLASLQEYRKQTARYILLMMILLPIGLYYSISRFSTDIALGVLLLAGAPAGITAIAFTRLMWGNTLLALCLAVTTTIIFPITLPLLLQWTVWTTIQIDSGAMIFDLILFCIIPIGAAYRTQRLSSSTVNYLRPHIDRLVIILITFMILWPVAANAEHFLSVPGRELLSIVTWLFLLSALLHLMWWYSFIATKKENQIAGSLAKWFMNVSIITVIAAKYFPPAVLLIVILYEFPRDLMLVPFRRWVKKMK